MGFGCEWSHEAKAGEVDLGELKMMTRIVLILAATFAFVSTASAKLPYQAVEDLVGQKTIVTRWKAPSFSGLTPSIKPAKGTTSVARAEFHFLGAMDLWIIDGLVTPSCHG